MILANFLDDACVSFFNCDFDFEVKLIKGQPKRSNELFKGSYPDRNCFKGSKSPLSIKFAKSLDYIYIVTCYLKIGQHFLVYSQH